MQDRSLIRRMGHHDVYRLLTICKRLFYAFYGLGYLILPKKCFSLERVGGFYKERPLTAQVELSQNFVVNCDDKHLQARVQVKVHKLAIKCQHLKSQSGV